MKSSSEKHIEPPNPQYGVGFEWGEKPLKCEEIQEVLFAYMSRELGETQSFLVHEHIRKCAACRAEAAEIEETLALLKQSDDDLEHDSRLSDDRRKRILRAVFHPVINWIDLHHKLVSIVLALAVLATVIYALRNFEIFKREKLDDGVPVWIIFEKGLPGLEENGERRENDKS